MKRLLLLYFIILIPYFSLGQIEEEVNLKYLINFLIERGDINHEREKDSIYDIIEINNIIPIHEYSLDFHIKQFTAKNVYDGSIYLYIESDNQLEVFDLCNTSYFYNSLFKKLEHCNCLTTKEILKLLNDLSIAILRYGPPAGEKKDFVIGHDENDFYFFHDIRTCW